MPPERTNWDVYLKAIQLWPISTVGNVYRRPMVRVDGKEGFALYCEFAVATDLHYCLKNTLLGRGVR